MKKLLVASIVSLLSLSAFAGESDLTLQGAKWRAKHNKYICGSYTNEVYQPSSHSARHVIWGDLVTDSTLDNGLVKATFMEKGQLCKYSAILLADNAAKTIRLVESKAFAVAGAEYSCAEGKAMLDAELEANEYLYAGHPHNLSIMIPMEGACGEGRIGINFVVAGRIQK